MSNSPWEILSKTQSKFVDYIKEQEKNTNRIIFYKNDGHFGAEYAILSRYRKVKLLTFKELKNCSGKNIIFRIIHILAAIVTCILNASKKIDTRTSVSTVIANAENIYLGIDKEKEFLKYLKIKKTPHKFSKIKHIIRVEENDIDSDEDISCLKMLCSLINTRRINNTILLIVGEQIPMINLEIKEKVEHIPLFQLQEDDLRLIARRKNIQFNESVCENIQLVRRFGIQFFIDNYIYFETLLGDKIKTYDWSKKMNWIITQIIKRSDTTSENIFPLLEFASFFENQFTKLEIQKFQQNDLEADNLEIAYNLAIIEKNKSSNYIVPTYFYKIDAFKQYFLSEYSNDLKPMPQYIFEYFRRYFPFEYLPALKILQIDASLVDYKDKQSLIICGYYFQKIEKGYVNYKNYVCFGSKDSLSTSIIDMYEYFRSEKKEDFLIDIPNIIIRLRNNSLNYIATCASYVLLLQFLKENYMYFPTITYSDVLREFCSTILEIDSSNNYGKYWQIHFKCQYIALSLEDEETDERTARRFMNDIQELQNDNSLDIYIEENHLRGFSRMDLLAFSLACDNAGDTLQKLYSSSEKSTIIRELARINYSGYLIETERFDDAAKILDKVDLEFLQNINIDTYCGYLNNYYLVQLKCKKINIKEYLCAMSKLLDKDINCSDKYIIENNWATSHLMFRINEEFGVQKLREILAKGNPYNRFYALHNLLAYYFEANDSVNFNEIYGEIFIPKLLKPDSNLFYKKFKWMKQNIGKTVFEKFNNNFYNIPCYNRLYLMSPIERWFE